MRSPSKTRNGLCPLFVTKHIELHIQKVELKSLFLLISGSGWPPSPPGPPPPLIWRSRSATLGCGRFQASIFCSFSVSLSLSWVSSASLPYHSLKLSTAPLPLYPMNVPHYYSRSGKYFRYFGSLFLSNHLGPFCFWWNLYRLLTPQVHLETYSAHEAW